MIATSPGLWSKRAPTCYPFSTQHGRGPTTTRHFERGAFDYGTPRLIAPSPTALCLIARTTAAGVPFFASGRRHSSAGWKRR